MSTNDRMRAWKDLDYRATLSGAEAEAVEDNPAGPSVLVDADLDGVAGGRTEHFLTIGCCGGFTTDDTICSFSCQSADCNTNTLI
jgi:mersacidin/lichenicidin family type 2 lantibiotic